MELSITETATLLHRSPRTIRTWLAQGRLAGRKVGGRWRIERKSLPLTGKMRKDLHAKVDRIRETLHDVLPSRLDGTARNGRQSIADLDAFQVGVQLLREWHDRPSSVLRAAANDLEEALLQMSRGHYEYGTEWKLPLFRDARARVSAALARVLLDAGPDSIPERHRIWAYTLQERVLPSLAGMIRWAERWEKKRR